MRLIRGIHNLREKHRGCVVTIGNFDGVHLGHQRILAKVAAEAQRLGVASTVVLFEPQPQEFFAGEQAPARLMSLRDKLVALRAAEVDQVLCARFDERFRALSAAQFVRQLLVDGLGVRYLVVGDDFRFGCGRDGDFAYLQQAGERFDFAVCDTPTCQLGDDRVSSTRVRAALAAGDFPLVEALLGRPYRISGRVRYGDQIGRTLDLPTVNLAMNRLQSPLHGVYAVTVDGPGLQGQWGAANVGTRPSVKGRENRLEVHLLDYQEPQDRPGDLYGKHLTVTFHQRIREEKTFAGLAALKAAITTDVQQVRRYFQAALG